jgi:hypothetical protein
MYLFCMLRGGIVINSQYKHVEIEIIHISVVYSPNIANKQHANINKEINDTVSVIQILKI